MSIPAIEAADLNNVEAEPAVNGSKISTISVRRLVVAVNSAKFCDAVGRLMTPQSMRYGNVFSDFKVEWYAYEDLRTQDEPKVPNVNAKEQDRKNHLLGSYHFILPFIRLWLPRSFVLCPL